MHNKLFNNRIKKYKEKPPTKYIHFDPYISPRENRHKLQKQLTDPRHIKQHTFYPLIQISIPKRKYSLQRNNKGKKYYKVINKERQILYSAHYDRLILSRYAYQLQLMYEEALLKLGLQESVIAYRKILNKSGKGKSNIDFAYEIFEEIKGRGECAGLTFDIEGFFDNLSWSILKSNRKYIINKSSLPSDHYRIFQHITNYKYISKNVIGSNNKSLKQGYIEPPNRHKKIYNYFYKKNLVQSNPNKKTQKGIPQGSSISAILSNIYMIHFDYEVNQLCKTINATYKRYSDDIAIICNIKDKEYITNQIYHKIENITHLKLQKEKEDITIFHEKDGLLCGSRHQGKIDDYPKNGNLKKIQYLGFLFDGREIEIRPSTMRNLYNKYMKDYHMAKGKAIKSSSPIFKKKFLEKYTTYKCKRSKQGKKQKTIGYIIQADNKMQSNRIRKQLKNVEKNVINRINKFNNDL